MKRDLIIWSFCGTVSGLALGLADALRLVLLERSMFFDIHELVLTTLFALFLCGFLGTISGCCLGIVARFVQNFSRRPSRMRPSLRVSLVLFGVTQPIVAWVLWQLTCGPRASAWGGRLPLVVLGSLLSAAAVGFCLPALSLWAMGSRPRRLWILAAGIALSAAIVTVDSTVLVRLYPVFHLGLTVLALLLLALPLRLSIEPPRHARKRTKAFAATCALTAIFGVWSTWSVLHRENPGFVISERTASASDVVALSRFLAPQPKHRSNSTESLKSESSFGSQAASPSSLPVFPGRNLFLITVDALRADRMAAAGSIRRPMPNLDALGDSGVVFTRAYTPYPHTSYAISSLLTGKYTHPLFAVPGAPPVHETWPEMLARFRYKTAAFFTNAIFFIDRSRFEPYARSSYGFSYRKVDYLIPAKERVAQVLEFLDLQKQEASSAPVFVWTHFFEAHEPYDPSCTKYGDSPEDRYDCELSTVDEALGALFSRIDADYPDAIVIATADHGEEFGDHGGEYHGTTLYDEQVRVPLIIRAPGLAHRKVDAPVSIVDLLGTTLALLDVPVPARVRSRDLRPLLIGEPTKLEPMAYAQVGEEEMIVVGKLKLVCRGAEGMCRLYDLEADPKESRSVAQDQEAVVRYLEQRLVAMRRSHAEAELRPVQTDNGLVGWPDSIRRALTGDRTAFDPLRQIVSSGASPLVLRRKAAQLLRDLGEDYPLERFEQPEHDEDPEVACWLWLARLEHADTSAIAPVSTVCTQLPSEAEARRSAAPSLLRHGHPLGLQELAAVVFDKTAPPDQRAAYLQMLANPRYRKFTKQVEALLNEYQLTLAAAQVLGVFRERSTVPSLIARFHRERFSERKAAIAAALAEIGDPRAIEPIATALHAHFVPPGILQSLVKLLRPGQRGRTIAINGQPAVAVYERPKLATPLRAANSSDPRVVVRARSLSEGGSLSLNCGTDWVPIPLSTTMEEIYTSLTNCNTSGGLAQVTISTVPPDLQVDVEAIAIVSLP